MEQVVEVRTETKECAQNQLQSVGQNNCVRSRVNCDTADPQEHVAGQVQSEI